MRMYTHADSPPVDQELGGGRHPADSISRYTLTTALHSGARRQLRPCDSGRSCAEAVGIRASSGGHWRYDGGGQAAAG